LIELGMAIGIGKPYFYLNYRKKRKVAVARHKEVITTASDLAGMLYMPYTSYEDVCLELAKRLPTTPRPSPQYRGRAARRFQNQESAISIVVDRVCEAVHNRGVEPEGEGSLPRTAPRLLGGMQKRHRECTTFVALPVSPPPARVIS
jgi:hypothetical protein